MLNLDNQYSLRKFGINLVGEVPWGTHLCQLYQTKQDLLDILVPYFAAGLQGNEYCLLITSPPLNVEEAEKALKKAIPNIGRYLRRKQLEICSFSDWYLSNGQVDAEKSLKKMLEKEEQVRNQGLDGLRTLGIGESMGTTYKEKSWRSLSAYEKSFSSIFQNLNVIALCAYPLECCNGKNVLDIERNHVGTLINRDNNWSLVEDSVKRKEREGWYKDIVQTSLDAFWITDLQGRFLEVNGAFCDLVGCTREELLKRDIQSLDMVKSREEIRKHIEKIIIRGHERFETTLRRKDGSPVNIELSVRFISRNGEGTFFAFAHNVTRRKRNEAAIKHSETRYRELANSIADSFVALDRDLRYVYWNKASERITGIKAKDAIGRHLFEVFEEDESTRKLADIYLKVLKTRKPRVFVDTLTMDGRSVVVENYVYPSKTGVSVLTKDVTQRKELQNKLEEYTQRLEDLVKIRTEKLKAAERLAAIGETAGMVGHDIRNPLQTISGELYLAKGELLSLPETDAKKNLMENVQIIAEQMSYINKIVADLQDYARSSPPCLEDVSLRQTVKDIMATVMIPSDIRVSVSMKRGFPKFRSDSAYLKRVLINLITNAVQAMPKGGKLTLRATFNDENVLIHVGDTGEGISEEAKAKIFKPLFTTKPKGQGLGLAVVKKLTNTLGGDISFESKIGKGTRFTVELPFVESNTSPKVSMQTADDF
ncbi:MAG: PAS domain S-box protein [Candidatus Bathyarchaeota archaeon]|nr:PAS domain S-box protein [Candidatus Bathyarchaeota archaeon]